jgi:L-lactate dehydrogenase (cytochrome)
MLHKRIGASDIEDLRRLARRRLPRVVFDYIDGGAEREITLRENLSAFDRVAFRPRCAVAMSTCDLRTDVLGTTFDLPFLLAPVACCRVLYPRGEAVAAAQAGAAGTAYILSTFSGCSVEDVKAASTGAVWFQLYLLGGREVAREGIRRAQAAGCSVLVVTVDSLVAKLRPRPRQTGTIGAVSGVTDQRWHRRAERTWQSMRRAQQFVAEARWTRLRRYNRSWLRLGAQVLARPRWLIDFLTDGGLMDLPNVALPEVGAFAFGDVGAAHEQPITSWSDLRWIRDEWRGPLVVKGVLRGDDACRAAAEGADAVVVSNHGGRELDGAAATLRALPGVVQAVGGRIDVLFDSGIRRGSDVVKALCLGARAVLIGRAYVYGLGASGGDGVARAIEILRADVIRTIKLLGCPSVRELNSSFIDFDPQSIRPEEIAARDRAPLGIGAP